MACIDDQLQPNFKHYCRVCKKGFMCGRALGGHMRAHGIGCENVNVDDDDDLTSDWEEKLGGGNDRPSIKRMYQLRTNPNRLKSCRICEHCGKEFLSWKSFLEHGKCSSDDGSESLVSSPDSEDVDDGGTCGGSWSKRKRSVRTKVDDPTSVYPESEEEDLILARCLVELANTIVDPPMMEPEESSASREEEERRNPMIFVSPITSLDRVKEVSISNPKGLFECKACNKVFNSHQALGGHRASHKKVKGCYAPKQDQTQENILAYGDQELISKSKSALSFQFEQGQGPTLVGAKTRKSKVHECSICHRVFSSGQALGGHKRCHWITSYSPDTSSLPKFQLRDNMEPIQYHYQPNIDKTGKLNLNFPAWANDTPGIRRDPHNPLSFKVSTDMDVIDHGGKVNITYCDSQQDQPNNENDASEKIKLDHHNNVKNATNSVDDEADSKLKLAKLSELKDLKDINNRGSFSQWLQVGIGSIIEATADT